MVSRTIIIVGITLGALGALGLASINNGNLIIDIQAIGSALIDLIGEGISKGITFLLESGTEGGQNTTGNVTQVNETSNISQ